MDIVLGGQRPDGAPIGQPRLQPPIRPPRRQSRSPRRLALPPLRQDAPGRRGGPAIGALPSWAGPDDRLAALEALERDVYAASTREAVAAKLRTVRRAIGSWGMAPYPPSLQTIQALGATLKRGGYRSAASYLWLYKVESQRRGFAWIDVFQRALKDSIRSCERGLGPPVRAQALPFASLDRLPGHSSPWVAGGPLGPRNAIIIGAWWMLRELELSTVRAAHVEIIGDWRMRGVSVRLTLPASKTDAEAFGTSRSHRCHCLDRACVLCPAHAVIDQILLLCRSFPDRFGEGGPSLDLPLFPSASGLPVDKGPMVATIIHAARHLGVVDLPDGSLRVSGHSLRPTGAQGLIALGWRADAVRLQGRWESEAVQRYTRDAALHAPSDLEHLVRLLSGLARLPEPPPAASEPEPAAPPAGRWVQNTRSHPGIYHLVSATAGKARCGWRYGESGIPCSEPPPWHHLCCKQCAPAFYQHLKAEARLTQVNEPEADP